jgi:hypothetical protein
MKTTKYCLLGFLFSFALYGCATASNTLIFSELGSTYKVGESIAFVLRNQSDRDINCGVGIEVYKDGEWWETVKNISGPFRPTKSFRLFMIKKSESVSLKWPPKDLSFKRVLKPGKYRLFVLYLTEGEQGMGKSYSPPFCIQ